jgi:hypothetical protein
VAARAQWRVFSTAHRQRVEGVDRRLAKMFRRLAKSAQRFKREFDALTTRPQLEGFLGTLERVISVAEASAQTYEYRIKGRSLKESFVNEMLAPIFEDCFGQKQEDLARNQDDAPKTSNMVCSPDLSSLWKKK